MEKNIKKKKKATAIKLVKKTPAKKAITKSAIKVKHTPEKKIASKVVTQKVAAKKPELQADKAFTLSAPDSRGVATLTFDLPNEKINKLSAPVLLELSELLKKLSERNDINLLVIQSAKKGIFIAGADIEEIKDLRIEADALAKVQRGQEVLTQIEDLPFPSLAVINGACMGGGTELILCCTYRIATDNKKTQIGLPEVNLGIFPGFGGSIRLPNLLGLVESLKIITSGKAVDAKKAEKIGLIHKLIPEGYLPEQLPQFINKILSGKVRKNNETPWMDRSELTRNYIYKKAREQVHKESKGHYPAPLKAIDVIEKTYRVTSLQDGLRIEREEFAKLCIGDISKNLIQIFYTSEMLKKDDGVGGKAKPIEVKNAALLGAGVMGGGIAWAFTKIGVPVRMKDISWDGIALGYKQVAKIYDQLKKIRKATPQEIDVKMNLVSGGLDYSGFKNADVVIEAVVENIDVKKKVLAETEKHIGAKTIIASNTSSLSINEMSVALKRPQNFVGMHFFNPVNRMPLVEVIAGKKTSPEAVATIFALSKRMGKTPILVGDCAGFIVNRILLPYMNEAVLMLEEGVDLQRIDKLMHMFGMPMGPFTLADEVGIDVCYKVANILHNAYGDRVVVSELLRVIYEDKKLLGKKAGKGFFIHKGREKLVNSEIPTFADNDRISDQEILDRSMLLMVNEAAMALEEGMIERAEYLDMAMIMGTGFPPFRGGLLRYADSIGIDEVVKRLKALEGKHGKRFKPAKLLLDMGAKKRSFY
jgi:3-hydroxyacyl-CoA dehydrogenase/enoyl-CoA hydratase/3-hydroxybutyryl-CoA epimerase